MDLKELEKHIRTLATLPEADAAVISCYLDNRETGQSGYRHALDERVGLLRKSLTANMRQYFEEALDPIEAFLRAGVPESTTGLAIFARGGQQTFFLPLQFRVPLPNWVSIDTAPNIYHLVELKDTYHRYVVLICTEHSARILGVNLGAVTESVWKQSPELRARVGRQWTKEHYQNHRRQRINRFINELIRVLDQLMSARGYGHLILAGNPRATSQVRKALPRHLAAKVVDVVPASEYDRTKDVVAATLISFIEQEERESLAVAEKLHKEINTHGLAVAGTPASFEALKRGQVDVLVLAKAYEPDTGWVCGACGTAEVERPAPNTCSRCGARRIREFNVKEKMVRMAEQMDSEVEVANHSDALLRLGGVGCLLRFLAPERHARGPQEGPAPIGS